MFNVLFKITLINIFPKSHHFVIHIFNFFKELFLIFLFFLASNMKENLVIVEPLKEKYFFKNDSSIILCVRTNIDSCFPFSWLRNGNVINDNTKEIRRILKYDSSCYYLIIEKANSLADYGFYSFAVKDQYGKILTTSGYVYVSGIIFFLLNLLFFYL